MVTKTEFLELIKRVNLLESSLNDKNLIIADLQRKVKFLEEEKAKEKVVNLGSDWVNAVNKNLKKPKEQLVVVNAAINEQQERKKRENNIIIYGLKESTNNDIAKKKDDDSLAVGNVLKAIGMQHISLTHIYRLKSKINSKPGLIKIELSEGERNPILFAAKNLKDLPEFKGVYLCPDRTEAEKLQDYELRKKRNELNSTLAETSPFRYAIRSNGIVRYKKQPKD